MDEQARPARLSAQQREEALERLPGWTWEEDRQAIARAFRFRDFSDAFAFMTRIALAAEKADHHPDWSNSWNRVDIRLTTHSESGLTQKDVKLAAIIDTAAAAFGAGVN